MEKLSVMRKKERDEEKKSYTEGMLNLLQDMTLIKLQIEKVLQNGLVLI